MQPSKTTSELYARYTAYFNNTDQQRVSEYYDFVRTYYDLTTAFYLRAWGDSFHFAPLLVGKSRRESLHHHQLQVARHLNVNSVAQKTLLDVGCGVGGPMFAIARYLKANIIGINSNERQVYILNQRALAQRLNYCCHAIVGDFMHLPFAENTLDGAYAFDATCHAPDRAALFAEIFRVLKPQARLVTCEWCLTDHFASQNLQHNQLRRQIELSYGLPPLQTKASVIASMQSAGFSIHCALDLAEQTAQARPWYQALVAYNLSWDSLLRLTFFRNLAIDGLRLAEWLRMIEPGSAQVATMLRAGTMALLAAGKLKIFTPLLLLVGQKN